MSIKHTRAIIDAIHDGSLAQADTQTDPTFGFSVPTSCPSVPDEILIPRNTWDDPDAYDAQAQKLTGLFAEHFEQYADVAGAEIAAAGPSPEGVAQ
jgi:phosphoenolpyruvate carboxykinase (ATP)